MFQGRDRLHIVPDYLLGDQSRHFQNNQEVAQGGYLNLTTVIKVLDGVSLRKGIGGIYLAPVSRPLTWPEKSRNTCFWREMFILNKLWLELGRMMFREI